MRTATEVPKTRGLTVSKREKKPYVTTSTARVRLIYIMKK